MTDDVRAEFEKYGREHGLLLDCSRGIYSYPAVQSMWLGYQAGRAYQPQAKQEAVTSMPIIRGALIDAKKAVAVLFTMLGKAKLLQGAAVADELGANIGEALKACGHVEDEIRHLVSPPSTISLRDVAQAIRAVSKEWCSTYQHKAIFEVREAIASKLPPAEREVFLKDCGGAA